MIRDSRAIAVGVIVGFLSACQTTYGDTWLIGPVQVEQIALRTYEVTAYVNAFTPASRADEFMMLKSSEVALENKADRFTILAVVRKRVSMRGVTSFGTVATIALLKPFETAANSKSVYDAKQIYETYKYLKKKDDS